MNTITPAVYDAAYQLSYAMARAGMVPEYGDCPELEVWLPTSPDCSSGEPEISEAFTDGFQAFTAKGEVARIEAVTQ